VPVVYGGLKQILGVVGRGALRRYCQETYAESWSASAYVRRHFYIGFRMGRRETEPLSAALVKYHLPVQLELALNHIAYQRYVRHHTTRKQLVHLRCLSLLQFKSNCIFFLIESCELCLQVLHARTFTVACPPNSLREYPRLSESTAVSPFPQLLHHPPAVL
jgi:hypothetical protein